MYSQSINMETEQGSYTIEIEFKIWEDHHYGEDADGNRGGYANGVDEITIKSIRNNNKCLELKLNFIPKSAMDKIQLHCLGMIDTNQAVDDKYERAMQQKAEAKMEENYDR